MSNRNYLQPSINPGVNPEFKGDVTIDGNLTVSGTTGTITATDLVLPDTNAINIRTIGLFIPTIVSASAAVVVQITGIAGTIVSASAVTNAQTTVGPATFTCSKVSGGVTTGFTGGVISIPTATPLFTGVNNIITANNTVLSTDTLHVVVGGTNTAAGTAYVTFRIQVSSL